MKYKTGLFVSVITTTVGAILLILDLYIATNLSSVIQKPNVYALFLNLISILPNLGTGLTIVGTSGIIVSFILESWNE